MARIRRDLSGEFGAVSGRAPPGGQNLRASTTQFPTPAMAGAERVAHLTAVNAFGRFAVESQDIAAIVERAVGVVIEALGAPIGLVAVEGESPGRMGVLDARPRLLSDAETDFVRNVGHVLAAVLERHHLETGLRARARDLQLALLPEALPVVAGVETAARYAPVGGSAVGSQAVGGDWYDLIPLRAGRMGLVIGDVEGHDAIAAAVMSQVRNVLRAYAADGHSPGQIMTRVNRFVHRHLDRLVTCCYIELRPDQRSLVCVSAGHLAPRLLTPAGDVGAVPVTGGLLLGVDAEQDYPETSSRLPEGSCLLLVTDGLVDDFPGAVHPSPGAFGVAAAGAVGQPIEALADALITGASDPAGHRDDAALLAVRLTAPDEDPVHRERSRS